MKLDNIIIISENLMNSCSYESYTVILNVINRN